jgi:hypothetical protein
MKLQITENQLISDIPKILKESLAAHYKDVLTFKDSVPSLYIKFLAYHAIAYFQYLNSFSVKDAINLYKVYILSDGKISHFYHQKFKIPLNFDELLKSVSLTLMNYKDIVQDIAISEYTSHFKYSHNIVPTYITIYNLLSTFKKIGLEGIVALRRHWRTINKEFVPYILKDLKNISTK